MRRLPIANFIVSPKFPLMNRSPSEFTADISLGNGGRKDTESASRRGSDQFESALMNVPVAVYVVDADFKLRLVNPLARPVFGGIPGLIGRDFNEVIRLLWPEQFADEIVRIFRHTLETGEPFESPESGEQRLDRDAREAYEWRLNRLPLPDGRFGVVCYFREISERKRIREELQETTARHEQHMRLFDGVASTTPDFAYVFDPQGRFLYANRRLLEVWGMKLADAVGKTCRELGYEQWHHDMHMREIKEVIDTKQSIKGEVPFKAPLTGIFGVYEYIFTPVFGPDGAVEFIAGTTRDVTDRKRAEEALNEAQQKLRRHAEDLKRMVAERTRELQKTVAELEHFSYSITHDMRAPLRAMRGFSSLLLEGFAETLPSLAQDFLKRISLSADRMDQLIVDALDYSKAMQDELLLTPVDPEALLRGMIESYPAFQMPAADVRLEGRFPCVLANQAGLTQCFSNLLNNAVKFVAPGQIPQVRIRAENNGAMVRLWIEDNGIGIPPEQHEKIFEMFQRLSRAYEGTGIGMALVRKVVDRMGGQTGVVSALGQGARFWLDLKPANQVAHSSNSLSSKQ
jgi:PAS domain S-box-containing protein